VFNLDVQKPVQRQFDFCIASYKLLRLHDKANIKQTSNNYSPRRARVF